MSESTGPTGPSEAIESTGLESTGPTGLESTGLESTGPTGVESTGPTGTENTGPTGLESTGLESTGPTGPTGPDLSMFPSAATGPSESPQIVTMEELMQSHAVVVTKESIDRQSLTGLVHPLREQYRPQLFQWAALGFPSTFVVQTFDITPPNICSDGVSRDTMAYLQFLLSPTTLDEALDAIRALMPGIGVSFSFFGNMLRIHVSKG